MCDEAASVTLASSGPDDDVSLLRDCFVRSFGVSPEAIVRAPGRVNLIGEHIDYNGYSVLPIAIDQSIFVAVGRNPDDKIKIVNYDTKFEPFSCDIHELGNISSPPAWHDYVLCGLYGVQEHLQVPVSCGINLAVLGRVPKAAGLSSSSALVCSAALAAVAMFSNPKKDEVSSGASKANEDKSLKDVSSNRSDEPSLNGVSFKELARVCAVSEKYVGTQGGGMDQAASFLSKRGCAQHISFNPLRCEDVVLPPGASFVVANSMVAANKAATNDFNCRVMECKIACYILAAKNGLVWEKVANMADLQHQLGNKSFAHMISLVESNLHPQPYTLDEVAGCLNISAEEVVAKILSENTKNLTSFCLQPRALHVFTEAKRVQDFKCICDLWRDGCADQTLDETLRALGALMLESHESARRLYGASHAALDELVTLSRRALGARLTGAGWGGCSVALVADAEVGAHCAHLEEHFYAHRNVAAHALREVLFASSPAGGAAVVWSCS